MLQSALNEGRVLRRRAPPCGSRGRRRRRHAPTGRRTRTRCRASAGSTRRPCGACWSGRRSLDKRRAMWDWKFVPRFTHSTASRARRSDGTIRGLSGWVCCAAYNDSGGGGAEPSTASSIVCEGSSVSSEPRRGEPTEGQLLMAGVIDRVRGEEARLKAASNEATRREEAKKANSAVC